MWGLRLSTRVWARQWGARKLCPCQPHAAKEVQIHLVKRLCALATDCTAHLNQPRRARNHHVDGRARRTRAGSKSPKAH